MGNASNLTSNVAFQTAQQLMDEAIHHPHCNITRSSRGLYIPLPSLALFSP